MKKCAVALLTALVVGCGGQSEEFAAAPAEPAAGLELVDSVEAEGGFIEFHSAQTPEGPLVLVTQAYASERGDLYSRLRSGSAEWVTPAELWRHATGREDVPEALALDHQRLAVEHGRALGYQVTAEAELPIIVPGTENVIASVTKTISNTVRRRMFPRALLPGTCWEPQQVFGDTVTEPSQPELFTCASNQAPLIRTGDGDHPTHCSALDARTGFWRAVAYSEPVVSVVRPAPQVSVRSCVWQSDTAVSCTGFSTLADHTAYASDASGPQLHRHNVVIFPTAKTPDRVNRYHMGAAMLRTGVDSGNGLCVPGL